MWDIDATTKQRSSADSRALPAQDVGVEPSLVLLLPLLLLLLMSRVDVVSVAVPHLHMGQGHMPHTRHRHMRMYSFQAGNAKFSAEGLDASFILRKGSTGTCGEVVYSQE